MMGKKAVLWAAVTGLGLAWMPALASADGLFVDTTTPASQYFDTIGGTATATLPTWWKADKQTTTQTVGTYSAAVSATERVGGESMSTTAGNGIYNFGATGSADRAVGFLSSSSSTKSGNLYAEYLATTDLTALTIAYTVGKYRRGSNAAGFSIQLYYSTDGTAWTSAGNLFRVNFAADADNTGYTTVPGATQSTGLHTLTLPTTLASGSNFYLAWNYSVSSGTTTSNAQALGVDSVSVLGVYSPFVPNNLTWSSSPNTWNTDNTNTVWNANTLAFRNGDNVNFTDAGLAASGTSTVTIDAAGVSPAALNVTNATGTYSFTTGPVNGSATLIKTGAGALQLNVANGYAGGTAIHGGTVSISGDNQLGLASASVTFGDGTLPGGTLTFTAPVTSGRTLVLNDVTAAPGTGGGTIDTNSNNVTFVGTNGTGKLVKAGNGALTFSSALAHTGETSIAGGGAIILAQPAATTTSLKVASGGSTFAGDLTIQNAIRLNLLGGTISGGGAINIQSAGTSLVGYGGSTSFPLTITISNALNITGGAGFVLNIGANSGNTLNINSPISGTTDVNYGVQAGGGAGTITLGATNTYTGNTTINLGHSGSGPYTPGTLKLNAANAIPATSSLTFGSAAGTGVVGGQLDLNDFDISVTALATGASAVPAETIITNSSGMRNAIVTVNGSTSTTFAGFFSGYVGLTKQGASTLTLTNGSNYYYGDTTVSGGTLLVNNATGSGIAGGGAVNVAATATIGGTGKIDATVAVAANGIVAPGGTGVVSNSLNVTTLTLAADSVLAYDLDTAAKDFMTVGTLNLPSSPSTVTVNLAALGTLANGDYPFLAYSSSSADPIGILTIGTAPAGTFTFVHDALNPNQIDLHIAGLIANLTWAGSAGSTWDVNTTANFAGGLKFNNGDFVTFDDTANPASTNVTIAAGGVTPGNVTFNNNTLNYTLSGGLDGTTGIQKSGSAKLTLNGTNTFTGPIAVTGGTLAIGAGSAVANTSGISLDNAVLQAAASFSSDRAISFGTTGTPTIDTNGFNVTLSTALTSTNQLVKTGTGALILTAAGAPSLAGGIELQSGTLVIAGVDPATGTPASGALLANLNCDATTTLEIRGIHLGYKTGGTVTVKGNLADGMTLRGTSAGGTDAWLTAGSSGGTAYFGIPLNAHITLEAPAAADKFYFNSAVRNASFGASTALVTVAGNGLVTLTSGATSTSGTSTHYTGTWEVAMGATGIFALGPVMDGGFGETLNALGYAIGAPTGTGNPVTVTSGTLAFGADHWNAAASGSTMNNITSFRNPLTLNGGNIASTGYECTYDPVTGAHPTTTPVAANLAADITVVFGKTSTVLLYDPVNGAALGGRTLNITTDPYAVGVTTNFTWGPGSTLVVDGANAGGGILNLTRTSGTVTVGDGAKMLVLNGAAVNAGGTVSLFNDPASPAANITLQVGTATTPGGTVNFNTSAGQQTNGAGAAANANLSLDVQNGTVYLNATSSSPLPDVHVFKSISTPEDGSGKPAHIVLGAGDPLGLGAGGTVMVQVYSGGTAAGQKPTRAQTEALWFQVCTGYVYGVGGFTTSQISHPDKNTLAMLQYDDTLFGGPGATFNAVSEDIYGDVNGDFSVDGADLAILLQHYLTSPGSLPGEGDFTSYTWLEGDLNGDFSVDGADLALLLGQYLTSYDPSNGGLAAASPVPEPASLGLLAIGALGLLRRRK